MTSKGQLRIHDYIEHIIIAIDRVSYTKSFLYENLTEAQQSHIMSLTLNRITEVFMSQITARLPDEVVLALDRAAQTLHRSRADIIRQAIEAYMEDFDDISVAIERLRDPLDESIDWQEARRALLAED